MVEKGDPEATLIYKAMAYQVAKEIGGASAVLHGKIDAIVLTGGLAYSKILVDEIKERVDWIADVIVHPGEDELQALAEGHFVYYVKKKLQKNILYVKRNGS